MAMFHSYVCLPEGKTCPRACEKSPSAFFQHLQPEVLGSQLAADGANALQLAWTNMTILNPKNDPKLLKSLDLG